MCIAEGVPGLRRAALSGTQGYFSVFTPVKTVILLILCIPVPLGTGLCVNNFLSQVLHSDWKLIGAHSVFVG